MQCRSLLLILLISPVAVAQPQAGSTSTSTSGSNSQVGVQASPSQEITFANNPGTTTIRNVPTIFAPSFQPTTPCSSVLSAGAAFAGFGLTIGGNRLDENCDLREMARLLHLIGQPDAALALLCTDVKVAQTSPQLCARSSFVATRPADEVSTTRPVMPPADVRPRQQPAPVPAIKEGTIGYGTDNRRYKFESGVWTLDVAVGAAVITAPYPK